MSRLRILNNRKGKLFVVAAPSGAGKSSLIQSVLANFENIELSISATTRSPREGEEEGKHYFFVTENEFNSLKEEGAFIESAVVHAAGSTAATTIQLLEVRNHLGYGARWELPPQPPQPPQPVVGGGDGRPPIIFRGFLEPNMPDGHEKGWRH